jgi:acetaldehyde dehydrogenase/alcohol dehydrogenase
MSRADEIMDRAARAAGSFRNLTQKETDAVVRAVYVAAMSERVRLAVMAHEETGIGSWRDKAVKNFIAAQLVYDDIRGLRTVGVVSEDPKLGLLEVAQPIGPVLGFIPVTNPTSTTIFKALIAMKTRNPLILSPHSSCRRSVAATASVLRRAAQAAGAPEGCIQWVEKPTPGLAEALMTDPRLSLILATGTDSLVRKARSSGTPVLGVGPGNVPVYIGASADIPFAVQGIIESKTFDLGTVCASEQAIVVKRAVARHVIEELESQGGHFLAPDEIERLGRIAFDRTREAMAATVVGQPADRIAAAAGFGVPPGTRVLLARLEGVGPDFPLSAEILAPILAFYVVEDFDEAIRLCAEILRYGGVGHTAVIYSNRPERIEYFSRTLDAGRILVNTPSTQGALGGIYNTLSPSFTLACGSGGRNITTDNISARHLLNIHRIARRRPNALWTALDPALIIDPEVSAERLEAAFHRNN